MMMRQNDGRKDQGIGAEVPFCIILPHHHFAKFSYGKKADFARLFPYSL